MRIIGGELKSRLFRDPPPGPSHPMGERIRGALFNRLGDLSDLVVLDAYAGSGALAFEAISRGAVRASAVEINAKTYKLLTDNCQRLGLQERVRCFRANITTWLSNNPGDDYDLVFADPPYLDIRSSQIAQLADWLPVGKTLVISYPHHWAPAESLHPKDFDCVSLSRYARANVGIWHKIRPTAGG